MSRPTNYVPYFEKLKDPRWQRRRLEIMERDDFRCQGCGEKDKTLSVHHKIYHRARDPWDYEDAELVTYCESCHDDVDKIVKRLILDFHNRSNDVPESIFGLRELALMIDLREDVANIALSLSMYLDVSQLMPLVGELAKIFEQKTIAAARLGISLGQLKEEKVSP